MDPVTVLSHYEHTQSLVKGTRKSDLEVCLYGYFLLASYCSLFSCTLGPITPHCVASGHAASWEGSSSLTVPFIAYLIQIELPLLGIRQILFEYIPYRNVFTPLSVEESPLHYWRLIKLIICNARFSLVARRMQKGRQKHACPVHICEPKTTSCLLLCSVLIHLLLVCTGTGVAYHVKVRGQRCGVGFLFPLWVLGTEL